MRESHAVVAVDDTDSRTKAQGENCRKLFSAVVLAALDDAIADNKTHKNGIGTTQIIRWARSRDGQLILSCAGIDPNERTVAGLQAFVERGIKTATALKKDYWQPEWERTEE